MGRIRTASVNHHSAPRTLSRSPPRHLPDRRKHPHRPRPQHRPPRRDLPLAAQRRHPHRARTERPLDGRPSLDGRVAASTLRSYIVRGEADVPLPWAVLNGRSAWTRPVAEAWAEQRAILRRRCQTVPADQSGASPPVGAPTYGTGSPGRSSPCCENVPKSVSGALRRRIEAAGRDIAEVRDAARPWPVLMRSGSGCGPPAPGVRLTPGTSR
jgi:hypothetical protein